MFLKSLKPGAASLLCIQAQRATEPRRASRGRYRRKPFQALRNAKKSYPHPLPSKGLGRSRGAPVDHEAPATARDLRRGIDKERYKDAVAWSLVPVLGREWAPPCVRRNKPQRVHQIGSCHWPLSTIGRPHDGGEPGTRLGHTRSLPFGEGDGTSCVVYVLLGSEYLEYFALGYSTSVLALRTEGQWGLVKFRQRLSGALAAIVQPWARSQP